MTKERGIEIHSIRLDKEGMESIVSGLEADLMNYLWKKGPSTVREIHDSFGGGASSKKDIALTTIAVTLDRMHSKSLVSRDISKGRGGLKYIYKAGVTKDELGESIARTLAKKLTNTFGSSFTSSFSSYLNKSKRR